MNIGCVYSVENYVSIKKPLPDQASIPFGIAYIATSLKQAGHNPHILVFAPKSNIRSVLENFIEKYRPRLICLTSVTSQIPLITRIAREIKRYDQGIFIILGGTHATLNPIETIKVPYFDAICIGEGEKAIVQLAKKIENGERISSIKNLWIKNGETGTIEKNEVDSFIQDLDNLPFIDRDLWRNWVNDNSYEPSILIGRGCPNKCSYCSNHSLASISHGNYVRYRSPANVVNEVKELVQKNPSIESIYLEVETLSINLKYAYQLFDCLEKFNNNLKKPIKFHANLSLNKNIIENKDFIMGLKRANFSTVNVGLESGSEEIRTEILRRPKYSNKDITKFCKLLHEYDIDIILFVMMGIPEETIFNYMETIEVVRECNPKNVYLSIFYPYPGTDLYEMAKNMGLFKEHILDTRSERYKPVLNLPGFSKEQIRKEFMLFPYKAYNGHKPMSRIIYLTIYNILLPHPEITHYLSQILRLTSVASLIKCRKV